MSEKDLKRDIAYVRNGNMARDFAMFRDWINGESFKAIGKKHNCRASLTATTCRRISQRLVDENQWSGKQTTGKFSGEFPESEKARWLEAADDFHSYLLGLVDRD